MTGWGRAGLCCVWEVMAGWIPASAGMTEGVREVVGAWEVAADWIPASAGMTKGVGGLVVAWE